MTLHCQNYIKPFSNALLLFESKIYKKNKQCRRKNKLLNIENKINYVEKKRKLQNNFQKILLTIHEKNLNIFTPA